MSIRIDLDTYCDELKATELRAYGKPDVYMVLTRPPFKRAAPFNLGDDGFKYELRRWVQKTFVEPSRGHCHLLGWGAQAKPEHLIQMTKGYDEPCLYRDFSSRINKIERAKNELVGLERNEKTFVDKFHKAREHFHIFARFERQLVLDHDDIKQSWCEYWRSHRFQDCVKHNNLKIKVEPYKPEKSRKYLADHHDVWETCVCSRPRPCRRSCWFDKNPTSINGWIYRNRKPLQYS